MKIRIVGSCGSGKSGENIIQISRGVNAMSQISISKIDFLSYPDISHLVVESSKEGFRHMKRLVDEYQSGTNRFDKHGEVLFVACDHDRIIGIGGLNQTLTDGIGRVRRLYISRDYRKQGIGRMIMDRVIEEAKRHYQMIELKTDNPAADQFYRSLGFSVKDGVEDVSHYLQIGMDCPFCFLKSDSKQNII